VIRTVRAAVALLLGLAVALPAHAQNGALFLLVPFGARAVGQGEAVVADTTLGTEALWWNAAAAARGGKREIGVHHSQTIIATSDMIAVLLPSSMLGTISGALYLVNYGDLPVTVGPGDAVLGTVSNRNYMAALSYASTVGGHFSAGMTYKFVMLRFECSGLCGELPVISGSSSALDVGMQYRVPGNLPFVIGASVRNIGPALQVKDREQADPLPRVIQVGFRTRLPIEPLERKDTSLELMADYKSAAELGSGASALGVVLAYRDEFFLRSGYIAQPGEGSGPSIGVGAARGSLSVDIARRFDQLSAQLGETPTYVSLRVRF
jgi:hypothetical protein